MKIAAVMVFSLSLVTLTGCDMRTKDCVRVVGDMNWPGVLEQYQWLGDTGSDLDHCGTVQHFEGKSAWEAYAWNDYSKIHYFPDQASAEKWIEDNWCVVASPAATGKR